MYSFYVLYYPALEGVERGLSALNKKLLKLILQVERPSLSNLMAGISPNTEALNLKPFISME